MVHRFESPSGYSSGSVDPSYKDILCKSCSEFASYEAHSDADSQETLSVDDDFVFYTISYENPMPGDLPRLTADVTPIVLRRGLQVAIDQKYPDITRLLAVAREDWTGEIDADAIDVIVQCGVLGVVTFG